MPVRLISAVALVAALLTVGCTPPAPAPAVGPVELQDTTVAELEHLVAANKGKVVLIDCWFLGCGPCRAKFPFFVDLHRRYAADGLVLLTLNVDPSEYPRRDDVHAFLRKQQADCGNRMLRDEPKAMAAWKQKYEVISTPQVVAFDRTGEWVPFRVNPKTDATVDGFVKGLLERK